jgi:hypothetical protein
MAGTELRYSSGIQQGRAVSADRLLAKLKSMADDPEGMRALFVFWLMIGVIGGIAALR